MPKRNGRRGNCYVLCESLYFLLGGNASGWKPYTVRHEGDVHWFLAKTAAHEYLKWKGDKCRRAVGRRVVEVLDPTAKQFKAVPPYVAGTARGFLTKQPSRRAQELMDRMLWSDRDTQRPTVVPAPRPVARKKSKVAKPGRTRSGTRGARR